MAITNAQQGLTNIAAASTTAFDSLASTTRNFAFAGNNPATVVDVKYNNVSVPQLQYPQDLGKYQFIIIESQFQARNDWGSTKNFVKFNSMYKLPLPVPLTEQYTVNYDHDFNLASAVTDAIPGGSAGGRILGNIATSGLLASGLSINQFKSITLKNPSFRTHDLNWKFSPKNFQESIAVQSIVYGLKRGMQPTLESFRTLFGFPNVYIMFFVPNIQYLYKFKPCVLQELAVDYLGGNPTPAFYGSTSPKNGVSNDYNLPSNLQGEAPTQNIGYNASLNPPESIVMKTRWLELEYWIKSDFKDKDSTSVTDVFNWYNNQDFFNVGVTDVAKSIFGF